MVSGAMKALLWTVVWKNYLNLKAKFSIYQLIYIATLTYCQEKNEISGLSFTWYPVRISDRRTADPLFQKEPAEVVQASEQDVSWLSPRGGIQGTSHMSVSGLRCVFVCMRTRTQAS